MATLIIEHDFSDSVRLSNIARVGETKQDYILTAFMSTGANISGDPANPDDMSAYTMNHGNPTIRAATPRIMTNKLNLREAFAPGANEPNSSIADAYPGEPQIISAHTYKGHPLVANPHHHDTKKH